MAAPNMEDVLREMTELTNTIKSHAGDKSTLDQDALVAKFGELLQQHQAAVLDNTPARPGEFQSPAVNRAVDGYTGKYAHELRDIARNGEHKFGNWRLKGADVLATFTFMKRLNELKANGHKFDGVDKVKPPSADLENAVKALTSTGVGTGDELVATGMAAEMWNDFFAASRVVKDLPTQPMPTDPFDLPLNLGDVNWRKGTQGQPSQASNPDTKKSTLTTTELVAEVNWTYTLDEDAVFAMMPALRGRLSISGAEQMDAFALNADATDAGSGNINLDDANPDNDSYFLSDGQDGIRHLALVDNTGQQVNAGGDALVDADMTAALAKLDKYGLDINNCRIVPGIQAYFQMLGLTNVATVDKYGSAATIITGELAKYRGVPIIPSVSMEKVEADGKKSATAANNTLGQMSLYNRLMWYVGTRRGLLFEVDRNIQSRQLIMVVSFRLAIGAHSTRSTATHTSHIRNFTLG